MKHFSSHSSALLAGVSALSLLAVALPSMAQQKQALPPLAPPQWPTVAQAAPAPAPAPATAPAPAAPPAGATVPNDIVIYRAPSAEPAPQEAAAVEPAPDTLGQLIVKRITALAGKSLAKDDLAAVTAFYTANSDAGLWLGAQDFTPRAELAMAEIRRADDWGLDAREFQLPAKPAAGADQSQMIDAEARLMIAVLKYARHARGGRMDPTQLSPAIDRTGQILDPKRLLADLAATDSADVYLRKLHPQHPQFEKLRRLFNVMRAAPQAADQTAKSRKTTERSPSLKRVAFNMEQWRWMPRDLGKLHILVNIPEFTVRVVKNGKVIHTERVVTGEVDKQTPIFSQEMRTVVFQPNWGIPNSIKVNELLPGLLKGRDTLERQGLEMTRGGKPVDHMSVDWSKQDIKNYDIVQPPGPSNALGVVKFLFPNKHDVYLHDTPSKKLFGSDARAFSHGCIRVRNPVKLAELIFAEDQGWPADKVTGLIKNGPANNRVALANRIPVHITYFTTTIDEADKPQQFNDIYGHQPKFDQAFDGKSIPMTKPRDEAVPVAQARPPLNTDQRSALGAGRPDGGAAVSRPRSERPTYRSSQPAPAPVSRPDRDWIRNVFGQ